MRNANSSRVTHLFKNCQIGANPKVVYYLRIMETSDSEFDNAVTQRKSLKRRSSVFQQRKNDSDSEAEETLDISGEAYVGRIKYAKLLARAKSELEDWTKVMKSSKTEVKKLSHEKTRLRTTGQDFDISTLTKKQQEFIKNAPNYEEFIKEGEALRETAISAIRLRNKYDETEDRFVQRLKTKIENIKQKVIELDAEPYFSNLYP